MRVTFFSIGALIAGLVLGLHSGAGAQSEPQPVQVSAFSGKPVPRFESLRYSAVHGRQGPSLDHPILWRYEMEGLPMLIVRETHGWRRVRDKDGDEVWVQARMLSTERRVVVLDELILRGQPGPDASGLAMLKPGVLAELIGCQAGWCEIEAHRKTGWVEARGLWGAEAGSAGL